MENRVRQIENLNRTQATENYLTESRESELFSELCWLLFNVRLGLGNDCEGHSEKDSARGLVEFKPCLLDGIAVFITGMR